MPVTTFLKLPCKPDCPARVPIDVPVYLSGLHPDAMYEVNVVVQQGLNVVHTSLQQVSQTNRQELNFVIPPLREIGLFSVRASVHDMFPGADICCPARIVGSNDMLDVSKLQE